MFSFFKKKTKKQVYCKLCGRRLFDKKSIARGYGAGCYVKVQFKQQEEKNNLPLFENPELLK